MTRATPARPAPTPAGAARPAPAVITVPPTHGPSALPTLKAEVADADARVGASPASASTWAVSGATIAKPVTPRTTTSTTAATGDLADSSSADRAAAVPVSAIPTVATGWRSPRRPPVSEPTSAPMPKPASTPGTAATGRPLTSVSSGET